MIFITFTQHYSNRERESDNILCDLIKNTLFISLGMMELKSPSFLAALPFIYLVVPVHAILSLRDDTYWKQYIVMDSDNTLFVFLF